jgi:hypothetical protein
MRRALWIVALVVLVVQSGPAVLAAPSLQGGQAVITSPHGPVVVRGNVLISGTAANSEFDYYKVEFAPGSNPRDDQWAIIGSTHATPVVDGLLETWYTEGRVPDGTYSLRLRVVRRDLCRSRRRSSPRLLPAVTKTHRCRSKASARPYAGAGEWHLACFCW